MIKVNKITQNIFFWHAIFIMALVIFTVGSWTRIKQPVPMDDLWSLESAASIYAKGTSQPLSVLGITPYFFLHPYLYLYSLAGAFKILGVSEISARMVGIISGWLAIIIVFLITKSFAGGNKFERIRTAALICLFYALAPATIQGASMLQLDITILVPALLLLVLSFAKYYQSQKITWAFACSLALALSLWIRLSTPLLVVFLFTLYILISRGALKIRLGSVLSLIGGFLFFLLSWYLHSRLTGVTFSKIFKYTLFAFQYRTQSLFSGIAVSAFKNTLPIILWIGPFSVSVIFMLALRKFKEIFKGSRIHLADVFLFIGIIIAVGYIFIGGAAFGFPKYQSPVIPLVYIGTAVSFSKYKNVFKNLRSGTIFSMVLIAFAIQLLLIGDLLYFFRYILREYMAFMPPPWFGIFKEIGFRVGCAFVIYLILCANYLRSSPKRGIMGLLILFAFGSNIAMSFMQCLAAYHTGYNYGEVGRAEAIEFIRNKIPAESTVVAPQEVTYYLNYQGPSYIPEGFWMDTEKIKRILEDKKTSAFVYSITTNMISELAAINSDTSIQHLLRSGYDNFRIGSYWIWVRKNR